MSDFHDPELRQQLGRLSGPYPDQNEAFAAWQRRVGQARRRRAMALTTGAAMSLIVAVVAVAALQGPRGHTIKTVEPPETSAPSTEVATSKPSASDSTAASTTESTTTVAPETSPVTPPVVDTTPAETVLMPVGGDAPPAGTSDNGGSGGSTHTTQPQPNTTAPKAQGLSKTITSDGGTITVTVRDGRLRLDDVHAYDGYEAHESDDSYDKVEVTFSSDEHKYEITAWLWNGQIQEKVVDNSDSHGSFPGESWGGGDGD